MPVLNRQFDSLSSGLLLQFVAAFSRFPLALRLSGRPADGDNECGLLRVALP